MSKLGNVKSFRLPAHLVFDTEKHTIFEVMNNNQKISDFFLHRSAVTIQWI